MTADVRFWDGIAESYAAKPVDLPEAFERKISITKGYLTPGSVVLDVGCGTGSLALRLAPEAAHVHGLDVSPEMMRIARAKAEGVGNVTFHVGTLDDARFDPESVDVLCAYSILHLVDDLDATLAELFRLLKPGGVLVSSTVCLAGGLVPFALILPVMRWFGKAPYVSILGRDALQEAVRRAGFVDLQAPEVGADPRTLFLLARKPVS
jgi:arsenite methyltransferase